MASARTIRTARTWLGRREPGDRATERDRKRLRAEADPKHRHTDRVGMLDPLDLLRHQSGHGPASDA
jgi:hypothetical protein